ncbi:MAG: NADH dehydrogenase [Gammaproteobacteria bacterium RIFCSPLOWO2_02_FULL_57_10]|nr:MAG: NADH dehydrogenase [Gammaproteobacteria bacterium RIFCSPLOWO2_02_FULL_57_10]
MIVVWLILILFVGGALAWASEALDSRLPRLTALIAMVFSLIFVVMLCLDNFPDQLSPGGQWLVLEKWSWIARFGIFLQVGVDGLSLLMLVLTVFLGLMAIGAAWHEITERPGFFYFNLLWTLAGVVGVFTALDLFLFFFFWEVMLIPMYLIIAIWGHENRAYAAMKFFVFTQVSGLILLIAIMCLAYFHFVQFGRFSFDYFELQNVVLEGRFQMLVMLGFFIGFATKLPAFPLHSWLPDAHSQAPTAGSVLLAGVLLKTGAYGLIRFAVPLFPEAAADFAPVAMTIAVIGILYCAKLAFAQTDIKRLIAYTSVSHMGFVLLGVYAWNIYGLQGALMTMLAHGLTSSALFMLAGGLQHRFHTRDMGKMSGLWAQLPMMSAMALFFSIAALGMPGLGNFIGEFLSLLGAFQANHAAAIVAALGLIFASVYSLWVIQRVFHGPYHTPNHSTDCGSEPARDDPHNHPTDLSRAELLCYSAMALGLVWMGMYPQTFLAMAEPTMSYLLASLGEVLP